MLAAGFVLPAQGATGFSLQPGNPPSLPGSKRMAAHPFSAFKRGRALPRDAPGDLAVLCQAVPCQAVPAALLLGGV